MPQPDWGRADGSRGFEIWFGLKATGEGRSLWPCVSYGVLEVYHLHGLPCAAGRESAMCLGPQGFPNDEYFGSLPQAAWGQRAGEGSHIYVWLSHEVGDFKLQNS